MSRIVWVVCVGIQNANALRFEFRRNWVWGPEVRLTKHVPLEKCTIGSVWGGTSTFFEAAVLKEWKVSAVNFEASVIGRGGVNC